MFNNGMIPIYYDAEFTGLHKDTTLISIGLLSGRSGSHFYAEFTDYDKSQVTDWIAENVITKLPYKYVDNYLSHLAPFEHNDIDWRFYDVVMKDDSTEIKERLISWLKNESQHGQVKLQFYTDCYAYDWVLMNHLICDEGSALNIPEFISYIPMDLSTILQANSIDPDISREEFVGESALARIKNKVPFIHWGDENIKHNSLWDAFVCKECFDKIDTLTRIAG